MARGYGPLDSFRAKQRYKIAKRRIQSAKKIGRTVYLDIGCGFKALFLVNIDSSKKYNLDKDVESSVKDRMKEQGIILISHDLEK